MKSTINYLSIARKILIVLSILAVVNACKSKKPEPAKPKVARTAPVPVAKINVAQKEKAYELGKRVLITCNTSRFKPFTTTEATDNVIKNTTEERLTKTCHNFRLKYGDFKDINFVEVIHNKTNKTHIYRFKALYEKKIANKELRVTMNEKNQVAAIKSLDWVDLYK